MRAVERVRSASGPFARVAAAVCALVLAMLSAGCGAPPAAHDADAPASAAPAWPAAPTAARIRFVRSVSGPRELGIGKSLGRRLLDALAGRGDDQFVRPTGVAELDGVLFVADPGASAVWILDRVHGRYVKATQAGSAALVSPVAVAARPDGAVYVADSVTKRVVLLDRDGELIEVAAQTGLQRPAGLAYDPATKRLFVADSLLHQVMVFGPEGQRVNAFGHAGAGPGELNTPTFLAFDRSGTLLVTDALNFRVQAFDRDGRFLWTLGRHGDGSGDLAAPKGLGADSSGRLLLVDALFDAVQIFDRDGSFLLSFGGRGAGRGEFSLPAGLFVTPQDEIFVADAYNRRVQIFRGAPETGSPP